MLRPAILVVTVAALGATAAAAEPNIHKVPKKQLLDPVWVQQQKAGAPEVAAPPKRDYADFAAIRRQTQAEKAAMMKTTPEALVGPVHLGVRAPYVNDDTYLTFVANAAPLEVLPLFDQAQMRRRPEQPGANPYVQLSFRADPARRYHVECEVAGSSVDGVQTISASDGTTVYSVSTDRRATLVFVHDPASTLANITITGERAWIFRGCDITSAPR
jgi:hypothetical protein